LGRLSDAKILGGIGSILEIIPLLNIVGYVLVLLSVKYISDETHDGSIFSDMLIAVIAGIVGVAIGSFVLLFGGIFAVFTAGVSAFLGIVTFLGIIWVALVVSSLFVRKAYNNIASKLNVGTFRTAGTLYIIGALLTIVLVGFFILFVAYIVQIVAFFSIPESAAGPGLAPTTGGAPAQAASRYCVNCGSQMMSTATFCPKCGAKQP
jgi:uncharacterized membrane protein